MRDYEPVALIRACTENTGVLTATIGWFDAERAKILEQLITAPIEKVPHLQGQAECLRKLRAQIAQMTRMKGEVDEQPRIRRVR